LATVAIFKDGRVVAGEGEAMRSCDVPQVAIFKEAHRSQASPPPPSPPPQAGLFKSSVSTYVKLAGIILLLYFSSINSSSFSPSSSSSSSSRSIQYETHDGPKSFLNTHAIFDYNLFIACAFFGKKYKASSSVVIFVNLGEANEVLAAEIAAIEILSCCCKSCCCC
jgi:hypothetical protein